MREREREEEGGSKKEEKKEKCSVVISAIYMQANFKQTTRQKERSDYSPLSLSLSLSSSWRQLFIFSVGGESVIKFANT